MKLFRAEQTSAQWEIDRSGKITASEMDALVTPLGKVKTGAGPTTYLMKKVAEAWIGGPLPSNTAGLWNLDQGNILEELAKPSFTLETGLKIKNVGFISDDAERVGCSPDGLLVDSDCGVEIKCPHIHTHIGYLLEGEVPPDYILQVQTSLYVTGFPKWYFYSFCRQMPPLVLEVLPDPNLQAAIGEAVTGFLERFDAALAKLTELNGGVRPEVRAKFAPAPLPEEELSEIIP